MKYPLNNLKLNRLPVLIIFLSLAFFLPYKAWPQAKRALIPKKWDAKAKADRIMDKLINTTAWQVRGAHDADMTFDEDRAYIVAEVNDIKSGESSHWPFIYVAMSIVNLKTMKLERIISIARGEQPFENDTLPRGACFVPRIIKKDDKTLRCFFASEEPEKRQSQTWYMDFDIKTQKFTNHIYKAKLKTAQGTFDMQPIHFYDDAARFGFAKPRKTHGLYIFDSFKEFDGKTYVAINNYAGRQNGLAILNKEMDTFEVVGHFNEPQDIMLCEPAVNRLPDGTWLAIIRQDKGNYVFSTSKDGKTWTKGEYRDWVPNGSSSKPTFDKFNGIYYLGWQERGRSVFNIDVSKDGITWERKYRFESRESFQYPTFKEHNGIVWLCVTQGRKERVMFGKLEDLAK